MESWRFDSITNADDIVEGKMRSMDFGNNMVFLPYNAMSIENQGFEEMCSPQVGGSCLFNHSAFSEEHNSSSVVGSNCKESGQFDLNLDKTVIRENPVICSPVKNTNNLNSSKVSVSSTQTQITRFSSSSPICQVHRCNKSLVSCKDYHKRHKVCELHSKTAKVIVNGIVQRFCQQCSRFHLLSEFDDGKRSCRKRLADHNERRRKPHAGRKFRASTRSKGISPSTRNIKLEDEMANDTRTISSITDLRLHSESPSYDLGIQYPSFHVSSSVLYPSINNYETVSADDFFTMDHTPARSLLSSQSRGDSSSHSSRNPMMMSSSHNTHQASGWSNNMEMLDDSVYMNPETRVWSGDGSTIDLLQLSSELERVEHQKEILHTKCA